MESSNPSFCSAPIKMQIVKAFGKGMYAVLGTRIL